MSPGRQRCVLVGRRLLDVAVHTDRAAVHDALHVFGRRGMYQRADRVRIHRAVHLVFQPRFAVHRRNVVDDLHVAAGLAQRRLGAHIAFDEIDPRVVQGRRAAGIAHQRADVVAAAGERTGEMAASEPGGAGYEDSQRSATTVTGEPSRARSPCFSSARSMRSVRDAEFRRL